MTHSHIHTPGHLLAAIPGLLGFYPQDSLVLMSFYESGPAHRLGPVLRINLDDVLDCMDEIVGTIDFHGSDLVFAFIISQRPDHALREVVEFLFELEDYFPLDIAACWRTRTIQVGERYTLCFGPDYGTRGAPTLAWETGRVASIMSSAAAEPFVLAGTLPELTRAEATAHLTARNNAIPAPEVAEMARVARSLGSELRAEESLGAGRLGDAGYILTDVPDDVCNVLDEVGTLEEELDDTEHLFACAVWLSNSQLRDAVTVDLLTHPAPAETLLLATAQTFDGTIRANALCLYAVIQMGHADKASQAGLVLNTARREFPEHSLTELLSQSYRTGNLKLIQTNVWQGSLCTRRRFGIGGTTDARRGYEGDYELAASA